METLDDDIRESHPVGWVDTGLRPVQLHIVHRKGILKLDKTTAQAAARTETLSLGGSVGFSSISGQPGYLVRTHELQLFLTKSELYRFLRRELFPEEVSRLRKRFGMFFEVEEIFYDVRSGSALEPLGCS